ncbi:MAG: prepilin-type N-terminal cleavage/methylation domain-containing protein [Acidiphilium sp.]
MPTEGFTLLEVLVALVILGLALGMVSGVISDSLARAERVATDEHAVVLADSLLAGLGRDMPLRPGVRGGRKDGLVWRLSVMPNPGPRTALPLDRVELSIATRAGHIVGRWRTLRIAPRQPVT